MDEPRQMTIPFEFGQYSRVAKASTGLYAEAGRVGLRHWGGYVFEEWLRELQSGRRAAEVYREMVDSDAVIGGIIYAIEILARRTSWWVEPGGDKTTADEEAAEFIEQCLFEDMEDSWEDNLTEILSMIQFGYSVMEELFKVRNGESRDPLKRSRFTDGRIGFRNLAIRAQDSLLRWEFDDHDRALAMVQLAPPTYDTYEVPLEKCLHFRTRKFKNNPEGRSLLRSALRAYYMIRNIENLEGIGVERDLAGLPMLTTPEGVDIWNTNDQAMQGKYQAAKDLVGSVRRDEMEGLVIPFGWKFELVKSGGNRNFNTSEIITRWQQRAATSLVADVILLGQDKVGSYALSSSKEGLFAAGVETQLDQVCSEFNTKGIPDLIRLNTFPGITGMPKLCHGEVQKIDLETLGNFLYQLGASGAPLWPNTELLDEVLDRASLPASEPAAQQEL